MTWLRMLAAYRHPWADPFAAWCAVAWPTVILIAMGVINRGLEILIHRAIRWAHRWNAFVDRQIAAGQARTNARRAADEVRELNALLDLPDIDEPDYPRPARSDGARTPARRLMLRRLPRTSRTNSTRSTKP